MLSANANYTTCKTSWSAHCSPPCAFLNEHAEQQMEKRGDRRHRIKNRAANRHDRAHFAEGTPVRTRWLSVIDVFDWLIPKIPDWTSTRQESGPRATKVREWRLEIERVGNSFVDLRRPHSACRHSLCQLLLLKPLVQLKPRRLKHTPTLYVHKVRASTLLQSRLCPHKGCTSTLLQLRLTCEAEDEDTVLGDYDDDAATTDDNTADTLASHLRVHGP